VAAAHHARAIATTRRLGYAPVEAVARRWLPEPEPAPEPNAADPEGRPLGPTTAERGLAVDVLGPVVVTVDGHPIDDRAWRSRKAREVLVLLALAGDGGRRRDEVIEAVWPDRDPAKGRGLLRTALADIRRILEPQRPPGEPSRFLTGHGDRLLLDARTDLAAAERLQAGGDARDRAAAWALFRDDLVADDPYAGSLDDARRTAEQLRADVAEAVVRSMTAPGATADPGVLVAAAAHLVGREPWREDLAGPVAAACRRAGDEVAAARAERLLGQ
jgi:DNA-binding SARP family transcriptional activator